MQDRSLILTRQQMAARREEAVRLLQTGELRQVQIARRLGVTEAAVSRWRKKLEEEGPDSLELHKAPGRPPKLKNDEKLELISKLKKGAKASGFETDQWDLEKVNDVIHKDYGIKYSQHYLYEIFARTGWRMPKLGPGGIRYFLRKWSYHGDPKYILEIDCFDYLTRRRLLLEFRFEHKLIIQVFDLIGILQETPELLFKSISESEVFQNKHWHKSILLPFDLYELGDIESNQGEEIVSNIFGENITKVLARIGLCIVPTSGIRINYQMPFEKIVRMFLKGQKIQERWLRRHNWNDSLEELMSKDFSQ